MSYENFKEILLEKLPVLFKEKYPDAEFEVKITLKNNKVDEGFHLSFPKENRNYVPVMNFKNLYELYRTNINFAEEIVKEYSLLIDSVENRSFSLRESKVIPYLINAKSNQKLLETIPFRYFLDLALVYRVDFGNGKTALVTKEIMGALEITEEELYKKAKENFKPHIMNMKDVVALDVDNQFVIGSSESGQFGAAILLYPEVIYEVALQKESNLFIIPSSVHECLFLADDGTASADKIKEMIATINPGLDPDIRLSNSVYYYDKTVKHLYVKCIGSDINA